MPVVLVADSYGKSKVRLTKVERGPDRHELFEWTVDVQLAGDFAAAYTSGDNRDVVATDTMKNAVYALAADGPLGSPETFATRLAEHFMTYPQVNRTDVAIEAACWRRIDEAVQPNAFVDAGGGRRTADVTSFKTSPGEQPVLHRRSSGLKGLSLLKTVDSAWRNFHRDQYRTLPDTADRILATALDACWSYRDAATPDFDGCFGRIKATLLQVFATHRSEGAQHTLYAMGEAALDAAPEIEDISIEMPNRHRIPFNLEPFGRVNDNSVFVATDEPHGKICGTLKRGAPPSSVV